MPDLSSLTTYFLYCGRSIWSFLTDNWFSCSILFVSLILPKLLRLFRHSIGI